MSRRLILLALMPMLVALAACGGSVMSSSTSRTSSTSPTPSAASPSSPVQSSSSSVSGLSSTVQSSSSSVTSPSSPSRPPEVPASRQPSGSTGPRTRPTSPDTDVRVPATFTIRAGGALEPPSVSVPAMFAVSLTAISGDGHAHIVLVRTPRGYSLRVPAHGRASVLIPGLHVGQYVIDVDGAPRGALSIGGQPGP
jgi:hypothetical protein